MKASTFPFNGKSLFSFSFILFFIFSCQKIDKNSFREGKSELEQANIVNNVLLPQTNSFSADVVIKWLNMQLDMLRVPLAPGTSSQGTDRVLAYNGIALYESVLPGMPAYRSLGRQLTEFPVMPLAEPGKEYHWAASANAALAFMNRKLFPGTSDANKTAMNVLENTLQTLYASQTDAATLQRSIDFGREVANRVFTWAATDGSANSNPAYIPPVGQGLWVPTAATPPVNPYARQRRLMVPGVSTGTALEPPATYSTDPASPFFAMVKDVYDKSLALTPDQTAMAIYHRDAPGYPGGGHFVAVLSQVLSKATPSLDIAALAYVKTGVGYYDAGILCFTRKYIVNLVRPITYIRNVKGFDSTWNPLIPTPNHPEYPSAHATNGAAVAWMLTSVFGDHFSFTLDTYNYLGLPARNYASFKAMGIEMANSRVFGGIHYQVSCDLGRWLGEKVGKNVLAKVKFLK